MEKNIFKRFKAALIDMDGVLYDSMPGHTLAWKKMMDDIGLNCTREEFYLYEGMTGVATINMLFERELGHGCASEKARDLYAVKSRYFREQGPARLMPGAARMLSLLKKGGLKRVLVTGSGQKSLLDELNRDYPGMFGEDMRVTAHDVNRGKPDPEPYLKGAAKARVSPADAIVIENAPLGVRAGKAAGCFTIAVTTGPIPKEAFEREGADLIFPSMEAFADYLEDEFEKAGCLDVKLRAALEPLDADRIFVLTDTNVREKTGVDMSFADDVMAVAPGESSKDLSVLADIWKWLSVSGATRRSVLVNIGGGVVTDLGGFAAAAFKRGIRFVNVPTTLMAAADAAIGGKTGIDFNGLKNEIGAFAMPEAVVIAPEVLDTLPTRELLSGFAEVVKMAMLNDSELYERLLDGDALEDKKLMGEATAHAAACKEEIVALDPCEKGLRRVLNLGHTAGHAFECVAAETGNPISHGEAVAHGLLLALRLSTEFEDLPREEVDLYRERILERYYRPLPFGAEKIERLVELMMHDKKNSREGSVSFVLLKSIGQPVQSVAISPDTLTASLDGVLMLS